MSNTAADKSPPPSRPRLNPRVIAMLIAFTAVISASVIVTDILSPRDRHPVTSATLPATTPATALK